MSQLISFGGKPQSTQLVHPRVMFVTLDCVNCSSVGGSYCVTGQQAADTCDKYCSEVKGENITLEFPRVRLPLASGRGNAV